jgi:hypothetical protein
MLRSTASSNCQEPETQDCSNDRDHFATPPWHVYKNDSGEFHCHMLCTENDRLRFAKGHQSLGNPIDGILGRTVTIIVRLWLATNGNPVAALCGHSNGGSGVGMRLSRR